MSAYFNPQTTSSQNQNCYQLTKHALANENNSSQNLGANKKTSNHNARSVTKFKRTNPNLKIPKPSLPLPAKPNTTPNLNPKVNYVRDEYIPYDDHVDNPCKNPQNLASSREMARTEQGRAILYASPSKEPTIWVNQRNSVTRQKLKPQQEDMRSVRSFRSGLSSNAGSKAENENYAAYWKKKAHEYLENNFKLSEEISELKRQLEKSSQPSSLLKESVINSQLYSEPSTQKTVPLHIVEMQQRNYHQQITQLEITNRLKDSVIENLQNKIMELTQKVKGDEEKSELMQKMRRQIQELEQKNRKLSNEKNKEIKLNKVYETQKVLNEVKEKSKPGNEEGFLGFGKAADYKFEKDLERQNRYRSLE